MMKNYTFSDRILNSTRNLKHTITKVSKTISLGLLSSVSAFAMAQNPDLPVDFESTTLTYYTDFGGNVTTVDLDPVNAGNKVAITEKTASAQSCAGTTIGPANGFANAIPLAAGSTVITVRVYSPDAGILVRLKVEDKSDDKITCETEAVTTGVNTWETLTFDFTNQATGTAALDLTKTFDKASIFFNFNTDGATAGAKTYYWDDVAIGGGSTLTKINLPVTFEGTTVDYTLTDFGGNGSSVVTDPAGGSNKVAKTIKSSTAEGWAGTTIGNNGGFATKIPFATSLTKMTAKVYSPDSGIQVRLKVEDAANDKITCETEATTTVANAWETLTFDFSSPAAMTAAMNFANTYDKASIFFNFNVNGATAGEKTYHLDDVRFVGKDKIALPITFELTNTDYTMTDFGGNASSIVPDPKNAMNKVAKVIKTGSAEVWAGTTTSTPAGLASAIPFATSALKMNVKVLSPDAGTIILLKAEDAAAGSKSVETTATTTKANEWETLEFDFSKPANGTAAYDAANTYNKVSIFFNYGTDGATAGEKTYHFDELAFGPSTASAKYGTLAGLTYYPNPVSNKLTISLPTNMTEVKLMTQTGQVLQLDNTQAKEKTLNLSAYPAGVYMVSVTANNTTQVFKIIK